METQDIIQNNKIIAEFMGGKFKSEKCGLTLNTNEIWLPFHGVVRFDTIESGKGPIIRYHKSWDWLMPVVEKIRKTTHITVGHIVTIGNKKTKIMDADRELVCLFKSENTFYNTYNAVIEFIKWYNTK